MYRVGLKKKWINSTFFNSNKIPIQLPVECGQKKKFKFQLTNQTEAYSSNLCNLVKQGCGWLVLGGFYTEMVHTKRTERCIMKDKALAGVFLKKYGAWDNARS